jgi:hypothetical protein
MGSSAINTFPLISRNNLVKPQSRAPVRIPAQYSTSDLPGGADDESEERAQADPDGENRTEVRADPDLGPTQETIRSLSILEGAMKKNPYLGFLSQTQIESLQEDPYLSDIWGELQQFLDDCEELIAHLAFLRSSVDSFVKGHVRRRRPDFKWKMQTAKARFLITELQDNRNKAWHLSMRAQTSMLMHAAKAKRATVKGRSDEELSGSEFQEAHILIGCLKAQRAAEKDVAAALTKTKKRIVKRLDTLASRRGRE